MDDKLKSALFEHIKIKSQIKTYRKEFFKRHKYLRRLHYVEKWILSKESFSHFLKIFFYHFNVHLVYQMILSYFKT